MFESIRRFFRPAPATPTARAPLYSEQAYYRMLQFFGTVPDPDLLLRQAGIQRYQLRRLEMDDEISGRLEDRVSALIATPWGIEPSTTRAAKFVREQMARIMETLDRATIAAVAYGYSMSEMIYAPLDSGRIGIATLNRCPIQWFDLSAEDGGWRYHPDDGSGGPYGLSCDPRKFIPIVRSGTIENPYGESLLSRLWFPVTWRAEGWMMWLNFLETFGQPIVAANVTNYAAFVEAMKAQGVRSVIAWQGDKGDELKTIQPATSGEFERMELALTRRIQKLILGNTMTTDGGQYGSRASGEVGLQVEDSRRLADIRMNVAAAQRVVNVLCDLNGLQPLTFVRRDETGIEASRAERDKNLSPVLQASGLKFSQSYFTDHYDLDDEDLEAAPPPAIPSISTGLAPQRLKFAAEPPLTEGQQAVEGLVNALMKTAPAIPIPLSEIRKVVMAASSADDLEKRLLALWIDYGTQDADFQSTLALADFAAQVLGYVTASENIA